MHQGPKDAVFLYGALRSGTTLLRLMLDAHPQLSCPGEMDFLFDFLPPGATADTAYDRAALEGSRIFRAHDVDFRDIPVPDPTPRRLLERIRSRGDVAIPVAHRGLERMLEIYPDMPILHLVRDPRDVARSSIGMGWAGDVYHGASHWIDTERDWQKVAPRLVPDQVLTVKYEDLIAEPEKNLAAICAFAGVPYDPAMMEFSASTTYDKPDPKFAEQWRRKLTPHEIGLVEGRVGPLLEQRGYAPSGHPPVTPEGMSRLLLVARNKQYTWAHRIRRYGVRDPLIVAMARRLGVSAPAARRRMDQIALRYLK
jgi:hypothetical protein